MCTHSHQRRCKSRALNQCAAKAGGSAERQRVILLVEPAAMRAQRVVDALVLDVTPAAIALRRDARIGRLMLADPTLVQRYSASTQCTTRLLPARLAAYIALSANRSRCRACVAS